MLNPTQLPIWQQLIDHFTRIQSTSLQTLFAEDRHRFNHFSLQAAGLLVDYSKNHITTETLTLLINLATACHVSHALHDLNAGKVVNQSEHRPALHSALRQSPTQPILVNDHHIMVDIQAELIHMEQFVQQLHASAITDIVNIGIGGSDLGPVMTCEALHAFAVTTQRLHFISSLDATQIEKVLAQLDPDKTLLIISSKSFTTAETLANATIAKQWLGSRPLDQHCVAVTSNVAAAEAFGIAKPHIFKLWPWVGGRYSIWSAIGLPLAIKIGMENFKQFLAGAALMDAHVQSAPLAQNMPVILALLNIWHINFFQTQTRAILPYDYRLARFPAYCQQLEMESNGKRVRQTGDLVDYDTGPIIWGELETNGQHAFHQLLHQGTQVVPVDFILVKAPTHAHHAQHQQLVAHCLSQARVLMTGRHDVSAAQQLPGNRPSTLIALSELSPLTLGALIALYEYKVFISATIWGINPFDQWGVEFGKQIAEKIYIDLQTGEPDPEMDSSTQGLMQYFGK